MSDHSIEESKKRDRSSSKSRKLSLSGCKQPEAISYNFISIVSDDDGFKSCEDDEEIVLNKRLVKQASKSAPAKREKEEEEDKYFDEDTQ